jgi:CRP-like cAMP-binding protein
MIQKFSGAFGSYTKVLAKRDVRLLFGGLTISATGTWAYRAGLVAYIYSRTHSLFWVGIAVLCRLLPQLVLSPWGGVIADRTEKVKVLVTVNALCTVWQCCLIVVAVIHGPVWLALVFIALNGGTNCIQAPAVGAAIPALVEEGNLVAANALNATIDNLTIVAGPMIGAALLLASGSVVAVFSVNAASFAIASLMATQLKQRLPPATLESEPAGIWRAMIVGVKAALDEPAARTLVAFSVLVSFVSGADTVLFVGVSAHKLGTGANGYAYLLIGLGVGGVLMAPLVDGLAARPRLGWIIVAGLAGFCLPTALMVVIHSPALGVLVQVVRGASTLVVDVLAITAMQRAVPNHQVGRVLGVFFAFVLGATTLGAVVTPGIADGLGLDRALLIMAFGPLLLGLGGIPALFSIDRRTAASSVALAPRVALLEQLGMFANAPRPLLERLASESVDREFRPGEAIISQGEEADYLYVLLEGEVHVTSTSEHDGDANLIRTLAAPAYFGEIGIINGIPRTANVATSRGCKCAVISGTSLLDALSMAPASGSLIATTRSRLARTHASPSMRHDGLAARDAVGLDATRESR